MQESNSSAKENDSEQDATEADSEATSKETLSELEENKADVGSDTAARDQGPSPDGAFAESDEKKDAGPM